MNDILSILLYDCVKCPSYEVTFSSNRGGEVSGSDSQVGEILVTYVIAFLRHWANAYIYEPWAGQ